VRADEVNKRIVALGGEQIRQRGSHRLYRASHGPVTASVVVPQHAGDIPTGTLRAIERSPEPVSGRRWLR